jgi:hypothetical protein
MQVSQKSTKNESRVFDAERAVLAPDLTAVEAPV